MTAKYSWTTPSCLWRQERHREYVIDYGGMYGLKTHTRHKGRPQALTTISGSTGRSYWRTGFKLPLLLLSNREINGRSGATVIWCDNWSDRKMYSETSKIGVDVNRKIEPQKDFSTCTPCKKRRQPNRPRCFGTSDVFFCEHMKCPRRKACEKLVSPWNFD